MFVLAVDAVVLTFNCAKHRNVHNRVHWYNEPAPDRTHTNTHTQPFQSNARTYTGTHAHLKWTAYHLEQTKRQTYQTVRYKGAVRHAEIQINRHTYRRTDKQADTDTRTYRQIDGETDLMLQTHTY